MIERSRVLARKRRSPFAAKVLGIVFLGLAGLGVAIWNQPPPLLPKLILRPDRDASTSSVTSNPGGADGGTLLPDPLCQKYDSGFRVGLRISCPQDVAIFVIATGVQVPTQGGWRAEQEDQRGEIWRLNAGNAREVCVQRPESDRWRAYVRYGTEMKGLPLLKAQLRQAWILRSFRDWSGASWGGGRWSGQYEVFSPEVTDGGREP